MRHKHRVRQVIVNYLLSFILMLSIATVVVVAVGKWSFCSERAIHHASVKTHYYYNLKHDMEQQAVNMAIPYGIDRACLKKVFTEDEVQRDVNKVLSEKVNGEKVIVDFGDVDQRIRANVEKVNGKLNAKQTESLNAYINKVKDMYVKKIHYPNEDMMATYISKSTKVAWIAIPLAVIIGFFCAFYLVVSRHYAYHGLRYVVYGVMAAGALISVGFAAIISNGAIYNYNIAESFMKQFYVYYLGHILLMYVVFGIGILVFGLIGIFLVYRQKYAIRG